MTPRFLSGLADGSRGFRLVKTPAKAPNTWFPPCIPSREIHRFPSVFELGDPHGTIGNMSRLRAWQEWYATAFPRGRTALRRAADVWPFTALGMALAAVALVALFSFGYEKLDLVLLVLGYGGAGLLAISTVTVLVTALALRVRLRRTPRAWATTLFETGRPTATGFALPSLRWLPLIRLRWEWIYPKGARVQGISDRGRLRESVVLSERGVYDGASRRIVVEDAFGLARIALRENQGGAFDVLPHLGGLRSLPILTSLTGGDEYPHPMGLDDGDRMEMRRYIPGDPARFIHWKAFGRTRKLMVRMPERALSRARRTVAYLVAGRHDEATAAAARAAIEEDALGTDWQFGADGSPEPTSETAEALHKVMLSAGGRAEGASGMRRFLAEVDRGGPAALVVFAPPSLGSWVGEVAALGRRRVGRIRVVIGIDAVIETSRLPRWRRWVFAPVVEHGVARKDLEEVGRALGRERCEVVIVDRVSGRILGDVSRVTTWNQRAA